MVNELRLKLLAYHTVMLLVLAGCETSKDVRSDLDLNQDGADDIFYEPGENGYYYELVDRNYDTKIDESIRFNQQNISVDARRDDDFNGRLDTAVEYVDAYVKRTMTDTNQNWFYDAVIYFKGGVPILGKVLEEGDAGALFVRTVKYKYGIPVESESILFEDSEQAFHDDLNPKILLNK